MKNESTISLIKKKRRGWKRLIFSRVLVIAVLLLVELLLLVSFFKWLRDYFPPFIAFQNLFSVGMMLFLFNTDMNPSAKLTWLFVIMVAPIPGTAFLWFTERDIGHNALKIRINQLIAETKDSISQDIVVMDQPEIINSGLDDLCRYVNKTGCFPVFSGTDVTYFSSGEEKFSALITELEKAEEFIFLEYFIIDEGYMWGRILSILAEKAKQGVEVRLMYDGMCEMSTLTADYAKRVEKLGIKCKAFAPIKPFLSTYYNYRDHRKILVIDGKTAFNGGVNLADEYINRRKRFGHWKDAAVMLRGSAVGSFTLMFLQMWNINEHTPEWTPWLTEQAENDIPSAEGWVMPYCDCPLDGEKVGENVYIDILYRASDYVHIMTPYLILDGELESALKYAAKRGIDVKIILPGIPDKKSAFAIAKTHYKGLIASGVHIYEYTPGFVHSKVCVSDGKKAVVGSINFDYRSLYHHFECATYMFMTPCISDIEADFLATVKKSMKVTEETIRHEKLSYKIKGGFLKIFSPLM